MARRSAILACVLLAHCLVAARALYRPGDDVLSVNDPKSFKLVVSDPEGVAMVEFYSPKCSHCQALVPQFKALAKSLKGLATVAAVDCDAAPQLCAKYGVTELPALRLFGPERPKEARAYDGPRKDKAMLEAVTAAFTDARVKLVSDAAGLEEWRSSSTAAASPASGAPAVLLFTEKREPTLLYKSMAAQLPGLAFTLVSEPEGPQGPLAQRYGVAQLPALLVEKAPGGDAVPYEGSLNALELRAWLEQFAPPVSASAAGVGGGDGGGGSEAAAGDGAAGKASEAEAAKAKATEHVKHVGLGQLAELDKGEDMWLLAFLGPSPAEACAAEVEGLMKAFEEMQAVVQVGIVALSSEEEVAAVPEALGVDGGALRSSPCAAQLVLLPFGEDKEDLDDYDRYTGPLDSGKALQAWVTAHIPTLTSQLDMASMPMFLADGIMPTEPNVGGDGDGDMPPFKPKILLVTNKDEVPGVYQALAMNFRSRGDFAFGWVQASNPANKPILEQLKPPKVPFLSMLVNVPPDPATGRGAGMSVQPYLGPMNYRAMAEWLTAIADLVDRMKGKGGEEGENAAGSSSQLQQLTDQPSFEASCASKLGICFIAVLDASSPKHEEQVATLAEVARKRAGQPLHFAHIDGRRHLPFLQPLRVMLSDLPTLVALSPKKLRYAVMTSGSFNAKAINTFVDGVLSGGVRTSALDALPSMAPAGGAVGEGGASEEEEKEEEEAIVEEEFDLSEIMGEEVEHSVMEERARQMAEAAAAAEEAARRAAEAKKAQKAAGSANKGKASSSSSSSSSSTSGSGGKASSSSSTSSSGKEGKSGTSGTSGSSKAAGSGKAAKKDEL